MSQFIFQGRGVLEKMREVKTKKGSVFGRGITIAYMGGKIEALIPAELQTGVLQEGQEYVFKGIVEPKGYDAALRVSVVQPVPVATAGAVPANAAK